MQGLSSLASHFRPSPPLVPAPARVVQYLLSDVKYATLATVRSDKVCSVVSNCVALLS